MKWFERETDIFLALNFLQLLFKFSSVSYVRVSTQKQTNEGKSGLDRQDDGYIDIKIYDSKDSFLEEDKAIEVVRKKAKKGEVVIPLSKVHEGKIAIVVYHDEDGDGKLKTGLFWRPKEGFAFSNKYQPKGPPKFSKASIDLVHGEPVYIELNY